MTGVDRTGEAERRRRARATSAEAAARGGDLVRFVLVGLVLSAIAPATAWAEVERVESIGFVSLREGAGGAGQVAPRDSAIRSAMSEAVHQVARRFLDQQQGPRPDTPPNLHAILGRKLVNYTARFRVIEDRGRQPAVFTTDAAILEEYVVVLEVDVDVDRVRDRLVQKGAIPAGLEVSHVNRIPLEVEGLTVYPAYMALRNVLLGEVGADSVIPLELESGRSLLQIESQSGPTEVLERLLRATPEELEILPLEAGEGGIHILVEWTPALEDESEENAPPARPSGSQGGSRSPSRR
jgi:hypothetical protein